MNDALGCMFSVFYVVLLIFMLINAAQSKQWTWFVLMLVIWPVTLAYVFFGYRSRNKVLDEERRVRRRASARERGHKEEITKLREEIQELREDRSKEPGT